MVQKVQKAWFYLPRLALRNYSTVVVPCQVAISLIIPKKKGYNNAIIVKRRVYNGDNVVLVFVLYLKPFSLQYITVHLSHCFHDDDPCTCYSLYFVHSPNQ